MPKQTSDYERKNVTFSKHDPDEMELWEWLKTLEHGSFATMTKQFWYQKMRESEKK